MNTKHLKAKILDLAIRGKLVPQDSTEGNAAELLQKIRDEKGGESLPLATAGKPSSATPSAGSNAARNTRSKNASFIIKADDGKHYEQFADGSLKNIEEEIPFEIPENWCWCRLKEIALISTGSTPLKSNKKYYENGTVPFITSADTSKTFVNKAQFFITQLALEENHLEINPVGSLIVAMYGEGKTRGQITELKIPATTNQACAVIRLIYEIEIFRSFVKNFFLFNYENIRRQAKGGNQANLNLTNIGNIYIPLPPLSEQKRIVSAIEKAFEQIDIIEKNKLNLKTYIKQTKSKVLDLAIHGKLVEQNPQEGNAFELLEKIRTEKKCHPELDSGSKQKKLKEDKKASFIIKADDGKHYEQFADGSLKAIEEEIPFQIPENWCWCRLRNIGNYKKGPFGSALTKSMFVPKSETTVKVYEQQNAIKKNHELGHYYIKGEYFESDMKGFEVHPGDILVSCAGTIGETYILPDDIEKGIINQALMKMTITKELNIQYFLMYFDHILKTASDESGKGTAMKNIPPFDVFKQFLFPLPPLSEQKRIVAKIEQVFEQLNVLEKSLGE